MIARRCCGFLPFLLEFLVVMKIPASEKVNILLIQVFTVLTPCAAAFPMVSADVRA